LRCRQCNLAFFDLRNQPDRDYWEEGSSKQNFKVYRDQQVLNEENELYDQYLAKIRSQVGKTPLIDFGCGIGNFLKRAKDKGWRAIGIEKSDRAINAAKKRGLEVFPLEAWREQSQNDLPNGKSERLKEFSKNAGCLVMLDTIEHFRELKKELSIATSPMRSSSIILIETPDYNFGVRKLSLWLERISRGKIDLAKYFFYPDHHYYFTKHNLESLLEKLHYSSVLSTHTHTSSAKVIKKLKLVNKVGQPTLLLGRVALLAARVFGGNKLIYMGEKHKKKL